MAAAGGSVADGVPKNVLKCLLEESVASAAKSATSTILLEGKIIVVGSMNTGKTSLILRLTRDEFSSATAPSLGVAYHQHTVTGPGCELQASIWDTAGYERFRALSGMYVRGAAAAILVYDVTSKSSLNDLSGWRDLVTRHAAKGAILAVAANKCDLPESKWQVSRDKGLSFARSVGARVFAETSAATGLGVSSLFQAIAAVGRYQADASSSATAGSAAEEDCGFKLIGVDKGRGGAGVRTGRRHLNVYGAGGKAGTGEVPKSGGCGC